MAEADAEGIVACGLNGGFIGGHGSHTGIVGEGDLDFCKAFMYNDIQENFCLLYTSDAADE